MADEPAPVSAKWEYKVAVKQTERHMLAELTELGREGWEAISLSYNRDFKEVWCWTAWLKRPWTGTVAPGPISFVDGQPVASEENMPPQPAGFDLTEAEFQFKD